MASTTMPLPVQSLVKLPTSSAATGTADTKLAAASSQEARMPWPRSVGRIEPQIAVAVRGFDGHRAHRHPLEHVQLHLDSGLPAPPEGAVEVHQAAHRDAIDAQDEVVGSNARARGRALGRDPRDEHTAVLLLESHPEPRSPRVGASAAAPTAPHDPREPVEP